MGVDGRGSRLLGVVAAVLLLGAPSPLPAGNGIPDDYGYSWEDEEAGCQRPDLSFGPGAVTEPAAVGVIGPLPLAQPWRWLDRRVDSVWISPKGNLRFSEQGPADGRQQTLPEIGAPNDLLAAWWFDAVEAEVTYEALPELFHVRWRQLVEPLGARTEVHAFLLAGGEIRLAFVDDGGVDTAVIGYETADASFGRTIYADSMNHELSVPTPLLGHDLCILPPPRIDCDTALSLDCNETVMLAHGSGPGAIDYSCGAGGLEAGETIVRVDVAEFSRFSLSSSEPTARFLRLGINPRCDESHCLSDEGGAVELGYAAPGPYLFSVDQESAVPGTPFELTLSCAPLGEAIACGDSVPGDTRDGDALLNDRSRTTADMGGRERLHRLELAVDGPLALELVTDSPELWVQLHDAAGMAANGHASIAAGEGSLALPFVSAGSYVLVVDGPIGSEAPYTLHVDCAAPSLDCSALPIVRCGDRIAGETVGASRAAVYSRSTRALGGAEAAWVFRNPVDQPVRFLVEGGDPRLHVGLLGDCDPARAVLTAIDPRSRSVPAGDYTLVVDGPRGSESAFELSVDCERMGPAANLVALSVALRDVAADCGTLELSAVADVEVANASSVPAPAARIAVFADRDGDRALGGADELLGEADFVAGLAEGARATIPVALSGRLAFADEELFAMVDSGETVPESDESDNVASTSDACRLGPVSFALDATLAWEWLSSPVFPDFYQVLSAPLVVDLDGDGWPEVVAATTRRGINVAEAVLRSWSGLDGTELWTAETVRVNGVVHPALGDLNGDGRPDLVTVSFDEPERLVAVDADGELLWLSDPVVQAPIFPYAALGGPSIADVDGDGSPEVAWGAQLVRADGSRYWVPEDGGTVGGAFWDADACLADLLGDESVELVAGPTVYEDSGAGEGRIAWTRPELGDGRAAVGDLDSDGAPELVLLTGPGESAPSRLSCLDAGTGDLRWSVDLPGGGPPCRPEATDGGGSSSRPVLADFDADGLSEIAVITRAHVILFDESGRVEWQVDVPGCNAFTTPTAWDMTGDGRPELSYLDGWDDGTGFVRVLDGATGTELLALPGTRRLGLPSLTVADVDADGSGDLVVPGATASPGLRVYSSATRSWGPARPIWSGPSYHDTNIGDDGVVPASETPSWTAHGTYRAQLPGRPPWLPDLTAALIDPVVTVFPDCSRELSVTLRVGNAGRAPAVVPFTVWLLDGGGAPLESFPFAGLAAGQWQDRSIILPLPGPGELELEALVDDDLSGLGAVAECREDNNSCRILVDNPPGGGADRPADVGPALRLSEHGDPHAPMISVRLDWSLDEGLPRTDEHYHLYRGVEPDELLLLDALEPLAGTDRVDETPASPAANLPAVHYYRVHAADGCEQVSRD